jgi:hypothetical protein
LGRNTVASLMAAAIVLALTLIARSDVRCGSVGPLSYDTEMRFCMRTDIYVAAVGKITADTPTEFVSFLKEAVRLGLRPKSVTFHSPGGNMLGGVGLGRAIRALKLDTHVGEGSSCASACMLAFIGGWSRKVTHDGRIGNHQFWNAGSDVGRIEEVQDTIAALSAYHSEMNVSALAVTAALQSKSKEMHWYSPSERTEWGIVTRR